MVELFTGETYRATRMALDASSLSQHVLANNIANVDTPRYRARRVEFEDALRAALMPDDELEGRRTRPEHLVIGNEPFGEIDASVTRSPAVTWRVDGNSVDIDLEVTLLAQNQGRYQAMTRAMADMHRLYRVAITGSGR